MNWTAWKWINSWKHNLPTLNYEEIENLNRPIMNKEIESVIKNFLINKSTGPDCFTTEFLQTIKEELIPILLKLFQKTEEEGALLNLFYPVALFADKDNIMKEITGILWRYFKFSSRPPQ